MCLIWWLFLSLTSPISIHPSSSSICIQLHSYHIHHLHHSTDTSSGFSVVLIHRVMPSRGKTFHCVCVICHDNNPDGASSGQDILLSECTAHLLRAKREEALRSGTSLKSSAIQRDTFPKESLSSTPPTLPTLPEDCYLDSSVLSSQSITSRYAARTEKREKNHLTRKAHSTFNVVEHRANEILNRLALINNSAGVQVVEEDIAVICPAFESVKRRVATINSHREKISQLFTQIDDYWLMLRAWYPPSIDGPLVYSTGMFIVVISDSKLLI